MLFYIQQAARALKDTAYGERNLSATRPTKASAEYHLVPVYDRAEPENPHATRRPRLGLPKRGKW